MGAQSFLKVADAVTQLGESAYGDDLTILYLLAQSIELSLKTFLRFRCFTEEQLITLDHRLTAALDAAEKEGFPKRSATDRKLLGLLDLSYGTGLLRYRRASEMVMPSSAPCASLQANYWHSLRAARPSHSANNVVAGGRFELYSVYPVRVPVVPASIAASR